MGIMEFKEYLASCYFTTGQMNQIVSVYKERLDNVELFASHSSILPYSNKYVK